MSVFVCLSVFFFLAGKHLEFLIFQYFDEAYKMLYVLFEQMFIYSNNVTHHRIYLIEEQETKVRNMR
ncbi:hypothetical protein L1987_34847 [Smallanthus sonchifolius]|uniref:Uncharacterized protein n=1 Tax=Smallanthus sonchifolius TaxID=185202 RepID=A0ACB9HW65_9ASTR|nr:hypothetical protein L1987_34847 [Smallanthus sonchifolius]